MPTPPRPRWLIALDQLAVVLAIAGMVGLFTGTRTMLSALALCASTAILGAHFIVTSRTAADRASLRSMRQQLRDRDRW